MAGRRPRGRARAGRGRRALQSLDHEPGRHRGRPPRRRGRVSQPALPVEGIRVPLPIGGRTTGRSTGMSATRSTSFRFRMDFYAGYDDVGDPRATRRCCSGQFSECARHRGDHGAEGDPRGRPQLRRPSARRAGQLRHGRPQARRHPGQQLWRWSSWSPAASTAIRLHARLVHLGHRRRTRRASRACSSGRCRTRCRPVPRRDL